MRRHARQRERERERESGSLTWIIVRAGRPLREPATLVIYTLLPPPPFLHVSVGEGGSCCGSSAGNSQVDIHSGSSRRPEVRTTRARARGQSATRIDTDCACRAIRIYTLEKERSMLDGRYRSRVLSIARAEKGKCRQQNALPFE